MTQPLYSPQESYFAWDHRLLVIVEEIIYDVYSTGERTADLRIVPFVTRIAGVQGQSRLDAR